MKIDIPVSQTTRQPISLRSSITPPTAADDDKALKKACKEFESLLVSQILHKMRDTVPKTDLFGSNEKEEVFQGMLDDEMAKSFSNSASMGIADLLYQQLHTKETSKVPSKGVD